MLDFGFCMFKWFLHVCIMQNLTKNSHNMQNLPKIATCKTYQKQQHAKQSSNDGPQLKQTKPILVRINSLQHSYLFITKPSNISLCKMTAI